VAADGLDGGGLEVQDDDGALRVLLDARMGVGGVGRYGHLLHRGLDELSTGCDVTVLEQGGGRVGGLLTAPYTPWGRRVVARRARDLPVDVVHNLSFEAPPTRLPLAVTVNDVIPLEHPASMPSRVRRTAFRRILGRTVRRADAVLVPSPRAAATLREHVGGPQGRLVIVPLAVDPVFRPAPAGLQAAARRRFADGRRYVAAVSTGRAHKNLGVLSTVADEVARRAGADVVLRGPAPVGRSRVRAVEHLSDEDLRLLYAGAAAAVVCSHVEGYGYTAVEAAACGTPVVCGPGLGALAALEGAVVVTDVEDPSAIADALIELLDDQAASCRLASAALAATAALTPAAMAAATLEVYREIVT
jgi:glycosyltransferase involved in cell wall biosynthesis